MLGRVGVVLGFLTGVLVIAACSSGDDKKATNTTTDGGAVATAPAARCHSIPNADDYCTCEVITIAPADEIAACDNTGSPNIACCLEPGSTGAGNGHGVCGCKQISCSEFSDGSCTCRTGEPSTEKPVETCQAPDQGHCCQSEAAYCTCSASPCFSGDKEVDSCNPATLAKTACASGTTQVDDCKKALK